jgi:hypothetical protein
MAVVDFAQDTTFFPGYKSHWGIETYVFSSQTKDFDSDDEADAIDGSAWGNRFMNELPAQRKASHKIKGLYSGAPGQIGHILKPMVGATTAKRQWVATETLNALAPIAFGPVSLKKLSTSAKFKDAVEFDAELSVRGALDFGNILVSPKSNTTMTATGNGSDLDNTLYGGATSFGGSAQLHVYDLAGGTTPGVTVVVQQSVDGSTWTTLGSFTVFNAATSSTTFVQRIKIPSTTTVNAHVRAQWTTTGTPTSVQALVVFARGVDPDA